MDDCLSDFFEEHEFGESNLAGDDLFAILDSLDSVADFSPMTTLDETAAAVRQKEMEEGTRLVSQKFSTSSLKELLATEPPAVSLKRKRLKPSTPYLEEANSDGQQKMSHITVERNRRKQMNEHLSVLRSLTPGFHVKRGDQASIIGGVVDYITELQQVLQSLEVKKQRKVYSEVLSPKFVSSPSVPWPLSPRKPPVSPRLNLPISPRTPQPCGPYRSMLHRQGYISPTAMGGGTSLEPSPTSSSTASSSSSSVDTFNELLANSKSAVAGVEVKFSGANVLLETVSARIPGQALKIISALEDLSLEIIDVSISTIDETMFNSFTIKIGIECQLSAEELAHQIQRTFS
ncbi:hypothetical protein SLEP1_g3340 [Rubroshorea leprosula]|uniref:BHLH domain-containing protein n=1 Tax=Rubroshorea leprosula TaxID=152421 RepID=A0AAV5HK52_9ROSI|nr:hypothetical protein SLEP1_g3340 [Rubroshorea leprosula]